MTASTPAGAQAPLVSCVMGAYRHERYIARALDALLAQDYPAEAMEIIVVDDGSPDRTAEVVEPYLDRIRFITKRNAGLLDTVRVMLETATGRYLAFMSGDDELTPTSIRRRVELLERRPEVGLCFGEMEVIDADSRLVSPSFFAYHNLHPHRGRVLGPLLARNFVSGGSMMFRAEFVPEVYPFPDGVCWEDWWIAVRIAQLAELDYLEDPVYRYRLHGENLVGGAGGAKLARALRQEVGFRRFMLRELDLEPATAPELLAAAGGLLGAIRYIVEHDRVAADTLFELDAAGRERAAALVAEAVALRGIDPARGARLAARALGEHPGAQGAYAALSVLAEEVAGADRAAGEAERLLAEARPRRTLAFADELVADPALLAAYAAAVGPEDPATLVIFAPDRPAETAESQLLAAITAAGIAEADCPDLLAVLTTADAAIERALAARVTDVLSAKAPGGAFAALSRFTVERDGRAAAGVPA